jgi:hypothetical protein
MTSTLWQSLYDAVYNPIWGTTYRYHNIDMKPKKPNPNPLQCYLVLMYIPQYDSSTLWQSLYEEVYGPVWGTTYRYHNTDQSCSC